MSPPYLVWFVRVQADTCRIGRIAVSCVHFFPVLGAGRRRGVMNDLLHGRGKVIRSFLGMHHI